MQANPIGPSVSGPHLRQGHFWRLLEALGTNGDRSQRELSEVLGTALGLTNNLLQAMVAAGWVQIVPGGGHRVRYEVTPQGQDGRNRLAHLHLQRCSEAYGELRKHVQMQLGRVIAEVGIEYREKRLVFYGGGVVAEVGYLCARGLGATVIGRVGESGAGVLVDVPFHLPEALNGERLGDEPFDRVVIMAFEDVDRIKASLCARGVPTGRIATL